MEFLNDVTTLLSTRVEALGLSAARVPVALVVAALLFPILLAALARQPLAFFSVLLVICGLLWLDPATTSAGALVAIAAYISSVLVGAMAVQTALRNRKVNAELARLRDEVQRLSLAEERRLAAERPRPDWGAGVPAAAAAAVPAAADPPPEPKPEPEPRSEPRPEPRLEPLSEPLPEPAPAPRTAFAGPAAPAVETPVPSADVPPPPRSGPIPDEIAAPPVAPPEPGDAPPRDRSANKS